MSLHPIRMSCLLAGKGCDLQGIRHHPKSRGYRLRYTSPSEEGKESGRMLDFTDRAGTVTDQVTHQRLARRGQISGDESVSVFVHPGPVVAVQGDCHRLRFHRANNRRSRARPYGACYRAQL